MDYDQVVDALFQPSPPGVLPVPVVRAAPARRLRDAIEPIAMHSVWCRVTNTRLGEFGMDFLGRYAWSRAALLGNPDPGVVVSSFAVFAFLTRIASRAPDFFKIPHDGLSEVGFRVEI